MMPIVNLQKRARELGRIRIGQVVKDAKGKTRPEKLTQFRLTSASKALIEKIAAAYGGEVTEWTPANGGPQQWQVITESTRLPVLVPPQPVSQFFEAWSGGGCQRRCDGERELLTDQPCLCSPDPSERECKPTTRLNVILRDIEGIGVWRLETHGFYAATELPEVAEFLAASRGYVNGHLALEERVVKRGNGTRRFMVPTIEVDVTPAALLAGDSGATQQLTDGASPALSAGSSAPQWDTESVVAAIQATESVEQLRGLWKQLATDGAPDDPKVKAAFEAQRAVLGKQQQPEVEALPDADTMWTRVLTAAPSEWETQAVEAHFTETTGVDAGQATAEDMARYLHSDPFAKAGDQS